MERATLEHEIFELYKEIYPVENFFYGLEECKDKIFIPSEKNRACLAGKICNLLDECEDRHIELLLRSMKSGLDYYEPHNYFYGGNGISRALLFYEVKGVSPRILFENAMAGIECLMKEFDSLKPGIRILTHEAIASFLNGITGLKDTEPLISLLNKYQQNLHVSYKVSTSNIINNLGSGDLGRESYYQNILKDGYNIEEASEEIEAKCYEWLMSSLADFKSVINVFARNYHLDSMLAIDTFLLNKNKETNIETLTTWREKAGKIIKEHLIDMPPHYNANVVVMPHYLSPFFPGAGAAPMNWFTPKFQNLLFLSEKPRFDRYLLLDILVHEEFGHNFNYAYSRDVNILNKLYSVSTSSTAADTIATNIELQFYTLLKRIKFSDEEDFDLFWNYSFLKRTLMVYLRAIADVRLNMAQQSIREFLEWAQQVTGIHPETIFGQIFYRQYQPGYNTVYPLGMHRLEELRATSPLSQKEFNRKTFSMGFPPREIFEKLVLAD